MTDKEKQVEEMAKEIFNTCAWRFGRPNDYKEIFNDIAEDLTKLNYRKITDDLIVLNKDEYNNLIRPTIKAIETAISKFNEQKVKKKLVEFAKVYGIDVEVDE